MEPVDGGGGVRKRLLLSYDDSLLILVRALLTSQHYLLRDDLVSSLRRGNSIQSSPTTTFITHPPLFYVHALKPIWTDDKRGNRSINTSQAREMSNTSPMPISILSFSFAHMSRCCTLARQVIQRLEVCTQDPEARAARIILSGVPEGVSTSEAFTRGTLPICLGIGDRRRREADAGTRDRPSGFGDPNPGPWFDATDGASGFFEIGAECVEALVDAGALPVRITMCQVSKDWPATRG